MKVKVSPIKSSENIKSIFACEGKLFVELPLYIAIISFDEQIYPSLDISKLNIKQVVLSDTNVFFITRFGYVYYFKLGETNINHLSVRIEKIKVSNYSIGIYMNNLYLITEEDGIPFFTKILAYEERIHDFIHCNDTLYLLLNKKILYTKSKHLSNLSKVKFKEIKCFSGLEFYSICCNQLGWVLIEGSVEFIVLSPRFQFIRIKKPSIYYSFLITDKYLLILGTKLEIYSIFKEDVLSKVNITCFNGCYDSKSGKIWILSKNIYELTIIDDAKQTRNFLIDLNMYKTALKLFPQERKYISLRYSEYLIHKNKIKKALKAYKDSGKKYLFNRKLILENIKEKSKQKNNSDNEPREGLNSHVNSRNYVFYLSNDISIPVSLKQIIGFLWMKATQEKKEYDFLFYLFFILRKYKKAVILLFFLHKNNVFPKYIKRINYETADESTKRLLMFFYKLYNDPKAIRIYCEAQNKGKIYKSLKLYIINNEKSIEFLESQLYVLTKIRSKRLTRLFCKYLGNDVLKYMQESHNYLNLENYLSIGKNIEGDVNIMLKIFISIEFDVCCKLYDDIKDKDENKNKTIAALCDEVLKNRLKNKKPLYIFE